VPLLGQPRHPGQAAAFFVDRPADFDASHQRNAGPAERLGGVDGGGNPGFHVTAAPAIQASITDAPSERVAGPPLTRRHDIEMPVQMNDRTGRS
jgi:hypothetical protein